MWPLLLHPVLYTTTAVPLAPHNLSLPIVCEVPFCYGFPSGNYSNVSIDSKYYNDYYDGATHDGDVVLSTMRSTDSITSVYLVYSLYSLYARLFDQIYMYGGFQGLNLKPEDTSRRARRNDIINDQRRARNTDSNPRRRFDRGRHAPRGQGVPEHTPRFLSTRTYITLEGFLCFYACMHIMTIAYIIFAHMCTQNALLSFSILLAPKKACKYNILFLATLHYTLAIPFAFVTALTITYITWHSSPTLRALSFSTLGFLCAALMHTIFYTIRTTLDHFFAPITSTLCYVARLTCIFLATALAITNRLFRCTFFLFTYTHLLLERISKYILPSHQAKWHTTSTYSNQAPLPNEFAAALAQYVRGLASNGSPVSNTPHSQYFAQYMIPPKPDTLALWGITPRLFSILNYLRARLFALTFYLMLLQSKILAYLLDFAVLFSVCVNEQYHLYSSSRYRMHFAINFLRVICAYIRPFTSIPAIISILVVMVLAKDGDDSSSKPPSFDGTRANFVAWVIAFSGWLAWKLTDAAGIADDTDTHTQLLMDEPDPVAEPIDHATWVVRSEKWHAANRKLYGAILQAVPEWLRTSIYHDHRNDGATALEYLHRTFDANDANDNAAHVARLGAHYIDAKSDLNEDDLRLQYDSMMIAKAGIIRTGNTPPDDHTLIAMYDNSLPIAYAQIRQLVRRSNHATLSDHYNDYMGQVRAELSARAPAIGAYAANPIPRGGARGGRGGRGGARGGGRGGATNEPSSNPCLRCGRSGHTRRECTQPKTDCRHCHADHRASFCPKGPGSVYRDALGDGAKAILERDVANAASPASTFNATTPNAAHPNGATNLPSHPSGATTPSPSSQSSEIPAEAHAAAAAAASSQTEPLRAAEAYTAALRALGYGMMLSAAAMAAPPVPPAIRPPAGCRAVSALVDSMATFWVVPDQAMLYRITNRSPGFSIYTANGPVPVTAVGIARVSIHTDDGTWRCFEVPNVLVLPSCPAVLYSTRIMNSLHKLQHDTDTLLITIPPSDGHTASSITILDDGTAYYIPVAFEPSRSSSPCRPARTHNRIRACPSLALHSCSAFPSGVSGTPQATLYHRLGFPPEGQWRHVPTTLEGHGLPPNTVPSTTIPVRDAVLRGRARAATFGSSHDPTDQPPPAAVFYMDFAGPLTKSFLHGFHYYCGVVDAGSGYGRLFPCHGPTASVASASLATFTADVAAKMRLTCTFKPSVVRTDQGSAFISHHFREFLDNRQVQLSLACTYTPQQNSHVERFWGITFATARVLLCAANLPPAFHPFALQTAAFLSNRLPRPSRGNQSPIFLLSRAPSDVSDLYCFGCLCAITLPHAWRDRDHHLADRGEFALYLGPSEISPGHVVYLLSSRKVATRPKIRVWEDQFPGLKGCRYVWFPSDIASTAAPTAAPPPLSQTPLPSPSREGPASASPSTDASATAIDSMPPDHATTTPSSSNHSSPPPPSPSLTQPPSSSPSLSQPPTSPSQPPTPPSQPPSSSRPSHPAAHEPSSRHFVRVQPSRQRNAVHSYMHDTHAQATDHQRRRAANGATNAAAIALYAFLVASTSAPPSWPPIAFINSIAATSHAANTSMLTTDMGEILIPKGYRAALTSPHASYWRDAIARELRGLIENETWVMVPIAIVPTGSNIMHCHYVFTIKRNADGTIEKFKARLVADGNTQKHGIDFDRVFSAVVKASTLRLLLVLAALNDYDLHQIDIRQAYLQAKLDTDLYMYPPPGVAAYDSKGNRLICKLRRSLYGLKQAGREWAGLFSSFLASWGFTRSKIDTCLYMYHFGSTFLWAAVYVDDVLLVSNDKPLRARFMAALSARFPTDDKGELQWLLGIAITRDRSSRSLALSQELYISDLVAKFASHISAGHTRHYDSPMEEGLILNAADCPTPDTTEYDNMAAHRSVYLSIVGGLLWLANMTRPDIAYTTGQLSRFLTNPSLKAFHAAVRCLIYLDGSKARRLVYQPSSSRPFVTYVDSSWTTGFSCSGAFFTIYGCIFHYFCKTQRSVTLSSAEAEYFGASLASKEILFFRAIFFDLGILDLKTPSLLLCDSKSAVDMAYDPIAFKKTKHILRAAEFLRDIVSKYHVIIKHLSGNEMIADLLTKSLARPRFVMMLKLLDTLASSAAVPTLK